MMGLYLLGIVMALIVSYVAKWFIKMKEKSYFISGVPCIPGTKMEKCRNDHGE